jgi:transposase
MFISAEQKLTFSRFFLEPSNATHRQYEALRAYFVEGLPSKEAAQRFGYTPGSFRTLVHQFRQEPQRSFFRPPREQPRSDTRQDELRQRVIALRKQNLSIYDISRALEHEGHSLSPVAVNHILKQEGFARLPRRLDEERPPGTRPTQAAVADVRQLDLTPRQFRTRFGGLFLFLPELIACNLDAILRQARFPGTAMIPAGCAERAL